MHRVEIYKLGDTAVYSVKTDNADITESTARSDEFSESANVLTVQDDEASAVLNRRVKQPGLTPERIEWALQQIASLDAEIFPGNIWGIDSYRRSTVNEYDYLTTAMVNDNSDEVNHAFITHSANSGDSDQNNNAAPAADSDQKHSGGRLAGFALLRCFDDAELIRIAVDTACRRQGIGEQLLDDLLREVRKREIHDIFLEVRSGNEAAIGLYTKAGFVSVGVRRGYYSNPTEDAIIMRYTW